MPIKWPGKSWSPILPGGGGSGTGLVNGSSALTAFSIGGPCGKWFSAITGPATDNEVGRDYIRAELALPAHNALRDAVGLQAEVERAVEEWRGRHPGAAA